MENSGEIKVGDYVKLVGAGWGDRRNAVVRVDERRSSGAFWSNSPGVKSVTNNHGIPYSERYAVEVVQRQGERRYAVAVLRGERHHWGVIDSQQPGKYIPALNERVAAMIVDSLHDGRFTPQQYTWQAINEQTAAAHAAQATVEATEECPKWSEPIDALVESVERLVAVGFSQQAAVKIAHEAYDRRQTP
ncbi:hypothetical protein ISF9_079 [Microbacterium phage vB_MoxS-ISF9]|uniref:Uncharacterized protein n=1 Tax=Microbacterium phage vB_MoxS-ISF9 TaxID=1458670 RepID=W8NP03_9CAUD|nr:hypothetical protein ISF9_079 [Microbacterium phage vB_MoxS-ISF9]AHL18549.1 hypothetical protein ISF9_079 [Microbacterium phage vB_MoxS-ISF9]